MLVTRHAAQQGIPLVHTDNRADNAAMLAINRELGFRPGASCRIGHRHGHHQLIDDEDQIRRIPRQQRKQEGFVGTMAPEPTTVPGAGPESIIMIGW